MVGVPLLVRDVFGSGPEGYGFILGFCALAFAPSVALARFGSSSLT